MPRVHKVIYEKNTGEVLPNCPLCGVYSFPNEDTAYYHFSRLGVSNREMSDITFDEKVMLSEYCTIKKKAKYQVDIKAMTKKLKDRERVIFTINNHGISYQDTKPVVAIKK